MNRIKNIAIFLLTLSVIALATLQLLQHQKGRKESTEQMLQTQADSLSRAQFYTYALSYGGIGEVPLKKEMTVTGADQKKLTLGQIIKKRTYIFHFDETNCFTCVEKYIPYLLRLSKKLGSGGVIVMGSYQNPINLFIALEPFKLSGIKVYNLPPSYLAGTKVGNINVPYIFETDATLYTDRFYIPEKSFTELSMLYEKNTPY